jgi:hypothetical protein
MRMLPVPHLQQLLKVRPSPSLRVLLYEPQHLKPTFAHRARARTAAHLIPRPHECSFYLFGGNPRCYVKGDIAVARAIFGLVHRSVNDERA